MGVFATRSPFRPNPIGLSCVRLEELRRVEGLGQVLVVSGADMMDGTPVYDIKPYLPYADCHPEALGGFAKDARREPLRVSVAPELLSRVPQDRREALLGVLGQDPRPAYQHDPERVYGFEYAGLEVRFRVAGEALEVTDIQRKEEDS